MTVTSAQYTENNENVKATINGVVVFVPIDNDNSDYQAILDWVADGNTIQDAS